MEREEPSTCLVYALCDEVGRIDVAAVELLLVFERVVDLRVRHGA